MKSTKTFSTFRKVAFAEGVSFLVLLLIAMPLKYKANLPMAVTIVGGLHGVLFVALGYFAWETRSEYGKGFGWLVKVFLASIIPFGTFYMEREWKREENMVNAGLKS